MQLGTDSRQCDAFSHFGGQLLTARSQRGLVGEIVSLIDESVKANPGAQSSGWLWRWHIEAGDHSRELTLLAAHAAHEFRSMPLVLFWLQTLTAYAAVAVELRAIGPAEQLLELFSPYHDQIPHLEGVSLNPVASYLGGLATVLGR